MTVRLVAFNFFEREPKNIIFIFAVHSPFKVKGTLYIGVGISVHQCKLIMPTFPSIGSDDPPPGVENVKIRENSEKNQGTSGGPLGTLYNPF